MGWSRCPRTGTLLRFHIHPPIWFPPSQIVTNLSTHNKSHHDDPTKKPRHFKPTSKDLLPRKKDGGDVGVGSGPARGPRIWVPDEEALGDYWPQLVARLGGREHGPLELHLPQTPRDFHRGWGRRRRRRLLPAVPRQKRGVRGWGISETRGSSSPASPSVRPAMRITALDPNQPKLTAKPILHGRPAGFFVLFCAAARVCLDQHTSLMFPAKAATALFSMSANVHSPLHYLSLTQNFGSTYPSEQYTYLKASRVSVYRV